MNDTISLAYLIIAPLFSAFRGPVTKENNASESILPLRHVAYAIDKTESIITWTGSKPSAFEPFGARGHTGFVSISKGVDD